MNPKTEELLKRTFEFGVKCLLFLESLPKTKVNAVITYQMAKASTSIGSNYEEAQAAESPKDFIHKIGVVLKESPSRQLSHWIQTVKAHPPDASSLVHELLYTSSCKKFSPS